VAHKLTHVVQQSCHQHNPVFERNHKAGGVNVNVAGLVAVAPFPAVVEVTPTGHCARTDNRVVRS
jgi:hypothetical protein